MIDTVASDFAAQDRGSGDAMEHIAEQIRYVAVIGTGSIGLRHLRVLQGLPNVRPIAISYRDERRAELTRLGYLTCANLATAVKTWKLCGCIVASDTSRHMADSLEVFSNGLRCLVEKPVSRNGNEARQLLYAALKANCSLYVGCVMRFSESLAQVRAGLARVGPVHAVRIECQSYLPDWRPNRPYRDTYSAREDEGGVLRDLIHELDYAGWLFGWPTRLQARLVNTGTLGIAAEESADLSWETKEGAVVSIRLDYLTRPPRRQMTVSGCHGTWTWDGVSNQAVYDAAGGWNEQIVSTQTRDAMFSDQARAFLSAGKGEAEPLLASGLDGVRAMLICDAARRASLSRCEESVETP